MDAAEVEALFTRDDGTYLCARWGRPLVPIVFGIEDATLSVVKGAFEVVCAMSGHKMAEHDPELGANVMVFFFRDWAELLELPDLGRMIDGLPEMVGRLQQSGANQYRVFRFDADGSIKAAFVFLRMDESLAQMPAEDLALAQVAQVMLTWGNGAFAARSPLGRLEDGRVVLRPEIGALIRAAYDPVMPAAARDSSHALRLAARVVLG
ncbi:hypothetical protein [Alloyangia pacifica]|uniref:hypothetical protein n=1 Tax=Alloyangia pacifica TaxID=311180 RepID=UPI001CFDFE9C|nr:hypothetical protein [Alloyangia pacifica]